MVCSLFVNGHYHGNQFSGCLPCHILALAETKPYSREDLYKPPVLHEVFSSLEPPRALYERERV